MSDLEALSQRTEEKSLFLTQLLDLAVVDVPEEKVTRLTQELLALEKLMDQFNHWLLQHKENLQHLKDIESCYKNYVESLEEIKDNRPPHMPKKLVPVSECEGMKAELPDGPSLPKESTKKAPRSPVLVMEVLTLPEFESIPQYMRGRVSYDQVNAMVRHVNTAVAAKYKILNQSFRNLNGPARKLHQRFKIQDSKDIKGQYFFVEDDLREFTQTKVDKRSQGILHMLRFCQRLREVRGGGVTRYALL